ncbi:MAG: hypothetical protein J2P36_01465, partial [Ktedonobacteraceae bacterium]|nr:hypothetical protein [Ktedonobacteraceae bacterium]
MSDIANNNIADNDIAEATEDNGEEEPLVLDIEDDDADNDDAEDDSADAEVNDQNSEAAQQSGGKGKERAKVGFKTVSFGKPARKTVPPPKQPKRHPNKLEAEGRMRAEIPAKMVELRDQVQAEISKYLEFVKQQPGTNVSNVGLVRSVVRKVENAIVKKNNDEAFLSELPTHAEVLAIRYCSPTGYTLPEKIGGGLAYLGKADLQQVGAVRSHTSSVTSDNLPSDPLIAAAVDGLTMRVRDMQKALDQHEEFRNQIVENLNKKKEKMGELKQEQEKQAEEIQELRKTRVEDHKSMQNLAGSVDRLRKRVDNLPSQDPGQSSHERRPSLRGDTSVPTPASTAS